MLGLDKKQTYEQWTAPFNPTSTYEGKWDQGSKIYFVGSDENGNKAGMVSEVQENRPSEFVSIRHYGFLQGGVEITSGEEVEKWAGGQENYTFENKDGFTLVRVDIDVTPDHEAYFDSKYPIALQKLKEISEK